MAGLLLTLLSLGMAAVTGAALADDGIRLTEAKWESGSILVVKGENAGRRANVTIKNPSSGAELQTFQASDEGKFEKNIPGLNPAPCRVRAETASRGSDERSVESAPSNCDVVSSSGGDSSSSGSSSSGGNPKNTFNIMMNYELGMHCTGFEFAYCCVLPPYNSILAQVVKTQQREKGEGAFARLLEGDPVNGLDGLGRETVLRDPDLGPNNTPYAGKSQKYVLRYWHEAQPRDGSDPNYQGENPDRLISAVEGNSLFMWNTIYDAAVKNDDGSLRMTGDPGAPADYNGATGVVVGDGDYDDANDSYANGWMNHLYIYQDLEGTIPAGKGKLEANKIRLGVDPLIVVRPSIPWAR